MNSPMRPPLVVDRAGERAVHRRAARLAQRLLRRPAGRRRHRAVAAGGVRADARRADRRRAEEDDGAPWHDQTMPLAERMKLAEGRPLNRRMMAAMGQQDCGQCGYNCKDYADALFCKKEERLNLCVPGGKETARMLKTLHAEIGTAPAAAKPAAPATRRRRSPTARPARSRDNPARRPSSRARGSTSRAPRRKPGTSSSI